VHNAKYKWQVLVLRDHDGNRHGLKTLKIVEGRFNQSAINMKGRQPANPTTRIQSGF
jgi:hypothetical protein